MDNYDNDSSSFIEIDKDLGLILDKVYEESQSYEKMCENLIHETENKFKCPNTEEMKDIKDVLRRLKLGHELFFEDTVRYICKLNREKK